MKKNKLFSLFAALLFTGSAMAAVTPTTIYKVGDASTLQSAWKSGINSLANYFVSGDTVIFQPYVCYQSAASKDNYQTWLGYTGSGSSGTTWESNECFKGSSAWFTNTDKGDSNAKCAGTQITRTYLYNITNCVSVLFYGCTQKDTTSIVANVYEIGADGKVGTSIVATSKLTGKTASIGKVEGLNGAKSYQVEIKGTSSSNGYFYEIAFVAVPKSPTLTSFTINGVEAAIDDEAKTITALLPYGTTIDWESVAVVLGGTATQWSINENHTQLTISNENGSQKVTYTLNITVDTTVSHDATLSDITLDGISLADFASATTEYTVELAYIAKVPAIEATTTHAAATVVVDAPTLAKGETGDASITVTAQDDTTIKIYTIHFTRAAAEAAKLYEVIFSNNAKGAIDVAKQTVTVPYLADTEEAVIPTTEEKNITVKGAGATAVLNESNQIVMTSADDIEIVFTIVGAPLVPKELGNDTVTFDSTEVYIFAPAGMNKEKGYGWVANKNVEEDSNPRITSGKCRMYIALPACDSVTLFIGTTSDRKAELYVNGVDNGEVTFPKSSKYVIKKGLSNTAANFIGIENHGSGDLGFTRILLSGAKDIGSAVDQTQVEAKAVKVIRDGQLLIIRDGKVYTAQGIELQ